MAGTRNYIDFEIIKEDWNKYSLSDSSKLKTRIMLKSAWFIEKNKIKNYGFDIQNVSVMMCDPSLQGEKNQTKYTKEQLLQQIDIDSCRSITVAYESNEYLLDDGTKILIHSNLGKISRTKLYNIIGDRIYNIDIQVSVNVEPIKT